MAKKLPKVPVVVVGMGWAGGIIASELTKAGIKVVGLERGKERDMSDYLMVHDELRFQHREELMQDLSKETITHRNNQKMRALPMRNYGTFIVGEGLGGAGSHWNGQTYRFLPYDFEIKSLTEKRYGKNKIKSDYPIQDWGITYDQIEPYYDTFEKMAGISGETVKLYGKRSNPYPTGPMIKTPVLAEFEQAAKKLGYKPYMIPSANLSENYENPDGISRSACQYCAFCENFGCEYGAKADPVVTVIPVAKKTGNLDLRTYSNVTRILNDGTKATGVIYVDTFTGEEFEQPAEVVVLASYVFNNVRLLLNSNLGIPYDPKTRNGVIGKNYCYQVSSGYSSLYYNDREFNIYGGAGALGIEIAEFTGDNFDHSDVNFLHGAGIRTTQYGNRPIANNNSPIGTPSWGAEFKKQSIKYANSILQVKSQGASMPHIQNYLDLDPTYKDVYGMPLLRMTYDYTAQDRELVKYMAKVTRSIAKKMGPDHIDTVAEQADFNVNTDTNTHNTGGVIMGADPKNSAVNTYLQMWDAENVFVAGSSAFPHNSSFNPTGTLGAFSYRAAEGIVKYLKKGGSLV
ncbi:GMC family oxidoreductase [Peribacillus frigoritolerans]|uniref:GMC family oxidoreductase n=1 Tax=Peribacillus TaxID=2675229 RepID=UPI000BA76B77|nr:MULTISPECIES: GMC family oxidoreductase [Peribacillus]MBD8136817.1 GMC family oxidoreductase [Bacillus sp. CFBP 13597]PHD71477.1 GMC family oxidoreductase [Bacillus sp. AFS043905]TDL91834.1 GMC family oxidoreductase [Vibrio vulnificus]AZV60127.1 GMC family oxidoreductase [Peribacillus frigoritolerans]MCK2017700.1 GMC family oxidoreductase [Peribacillus frigoritolerans]